jgi:tetratricopeptide (TPR) repeat protein
MPLFSFRPICHAAICIWVTAFTPVPAAAQATSLLEIPMFLEQAGNAIRGGRYVQAKEMLDQVPQVLPAIYADEAALLRTELFVAEDNVGDASLALSQIGDHAHARCRQDSVRGWLAGKKGDVNRSILLLANVTMLCPKDVQSWNLLGLAFIEKGEAAAALDAFNQALALAPEHPALLNNLALAQISSAQLDVAEQNLARALRFEPGNAAIAANHDYVVAMRGKLPLRKEGEADQAWAMRLLYAGEGAREASNAPMASAMFAQAVLLLDHFDPKAWQRAREYKADPAQ